MTCQFHYLLPKLLNVNNIIIVHIHVHLAIIQTQTTSIVRAKAAGTQIYMYAIGLATYVSTCKLGIDQLFSQCIYVGILDCPNTELVPGKANSQLCAHVLAGQFYVCTECRITWRPNCLMDITNLQWNFSYSTTWTSKHSLLP